MKINANGSCLVFFATVIILIASFTAYNIFRLGRTYITIDGKYNFSIKKKVLHSDNNHTIVYSPLGIEKTEENLSEFIKKDLNFRNSFLLKYFPPTIFDLDFISYSYNYLIMNMEHLKRAIGYSNYQKKIVSNYSSFKIGNFRFGAPGISKNHHILCNIELNIDDNFKILNERHFYKTEMHEYAEQLLTYLTNVILDAKSENYYYEKDYLLRWVFDGLAELISYQYFFALENIPEELKKREREKLLDYETCQSYDILNWSYPIHYREDIPCYVDEALNDYDDYVDPLHELYYRKSYHFFLHLYEIHGINLIRDLIQYIFDNRQFLKSEDILLFLENRVGKELLESLLGANYIERVELNRRRLFLNIYNYYRTNNNDSGIEYFFISSGKNHSYVPDLDLEF